MKATGRVLKNHNKLNKVINIDTMIEDTYISGDNSCIIDICNSINDLDIPNDMKLLLSLENINHGFESNGKVYNKEMVMESIVDYFLFNNLTSDETTKILERVHIKKKPDVSKFKKLVEDFPMKGIKSKIDVKNFINRFYTMSKNNILDDTPNLLSWIRKGLVFATFGVNIYLGALTLFIDKFIEMNIQRNEVKKMINKMESEKKTIERKLETSKSDKTKETYNKYLKEIDDNLYKLRNYEESLYSEKELDERDDEEMNFESRSIDIDDYYEEVHHNFVNEIEKINEEFNRLNKTVYRDLAERNVIFSCTESEIDRFRNIDKECITEYTNVYGKLDFVVGEILPYNMKTCNEETLAELTERVRRLCGDLDNACNVDVIVYYEIVDDIGKIIASSDVKITGIEEDTVNLTTKKNLAFILAVEDAVKNIESNLFDTTAIFENHDYSIETIEFITEATLQTPDIIDSDKLSEYLKSIKEESIIKEDIVSSLVRSTIIQESIYRLADKNRKTILNKNRYEILAETLSYANNLEYLNEISVGNKLKLAKATLTKNAQRMSDKEKALSRQMDNALDNFYNKIEKELTNKNREKVIKGTILPSASSIFKIAIASGAAFFINPAISVIMVLGSLAVSKGATSKEKQYILDEINIMLKMVDKKIQLAESNNDMKALEQLLRSQQQLERERQRIKYNLRRRNYPIYK